MIANIQWFFQISMFYLFSLSLIMSYCFYVEIDVYLYLPGETAMALNIVEQIAKL